MEKSKIEVDLVWNLSYFSYENNEVHTNMVGIRVDLILKSNQSE